MKKKKVRYTIVDFDKQFSNSDACLRYIFNHKYKNSDGNISCKICKYKNSYYRVKARKCYSCSHCGEQLHPTAGTIFHKSSTPLKLWFYAIFLMSQSKNGVSAKELERHLGVTYKTAWRMANRIRGLMDSGTDPMSGIVEVDETYIGGEEKNKHKSKRTTGTQGRNTKTKTAVFGALERQGNVAVKIVNNVRSKTLLPILKDWVNEGAKVMTDEFKSYLPVRRNGFRHETVNHSQEKYAYGEIHTNSIEGFWSQVKRSIDGTYHVVSSAYLPLYLAEFVFRYNRRNSDTPMFHHLMNQV